MGSKRESTSKKSVATRKKTPLRDLGKSKGELTDNQAKTVKGGGISHRPGPREVPMDQ